MSLVDIDDLKLEEKVIRVDNIEKKTSSNGNDYVLVTDMSGSKFYVWNEAWQEILMERSDFYKSCTMRVNYVSEDPPYYCVFRYMYPIDWEDKPPKEQDFEVDFDMTEDEQDDGTINANDVPREERIVNQASMKFAAKMLDHKIPSDDAWSDELIEEELNKWMSKFKRGMVKGEIE